MCNETYSNGHCASENLRRRLGEQATAEESTFLNLAN